ncbi:hypothetical protein B0J13DRAFT_302817 [Dactylonectria estremocensis]|uniref:C2H2-type domain-containing protein n=1 Tax=Dactylonectria estremocensis TaxID=1079267 RepID=A0A9P9EWX0_9HYPO|nr:hypothetical protein B0J13DRAFT_302817 [Dactylonectria estremocensis]
MAYSSYSTRQDADGLISGIHPSFIDHHGSQIQQGSFLSLIDPKLMGDTSQMQRYLQDPHRPVFDVQMLPQNDYTFGAVQSGSITTIAPRPQFGRHDSPFSQHQSSGGSSAQSPRTETDLYHDSTQGPSTPPDARSPFLTHVYDNWEGPLLSGLSCRPEGCVNLSDIHPSQVALADIDESDGSKSFSLDQELANYDNSTPSAHYLGEVASHMPLLRISSPASNTHDRSAIEPAYPDLENTEKQSNPDEVAIETPSRTRGGQKRMSTFDNLTRASKNANRRGRPKRTVTSMLTEPARVGKTTSFSRAPASRRLPTPLATIQHTCPHCQESLKDDATLQRHIRSQHNHPFTCVFHFAGCPETFANKNEWKRHVSAQHLSLHFWLCVQGACGHVTDEDSQVSGAATHGRPFRRKDLFTQHIRRMHPFPCLGETGRNKRTTPEQNKLLKGMQDSAWQRRCVTPTHMRCPAQACGQLFNGEKAWDERMEHVARHLERAANGEEPRVQFGNAHDATLVNWAASEGVNVIHATPEGGWKLGQPLTNSRVKLRAVSSHKTMVDEDAEGEAY